MTKCFNLFIKNINERPWMITPMFSSMASVRCATLHLQLTRRYDSSQIIEWAAQCLSSEAIIDEARESGRKSMLVSTMGPTKRVKARRCGKRLAFLRSNVS